MSFVLLVFLVASVHGVLVSKAPIASTKCVVCETVITEVIGSISSNATIAEIGNELAMFCTALPGILQTACKAVDKALVAVLKGIPASLQKGQYSPYALCSMLNYCEIPCCLSSKPEQIALALTGDDSELSVSWVTALNATASPPCVSYVLSSAAPGTPWQTTCGNVTTYTDAGWRGSINNVVLKNLERRSTYNYTVGGANVPQSAVYEFVTPPYLDEASGDPLIIALIGDMGSTNESTPTVDRLTAAAKSRSIDLILHDGDIAYSDGFELLYDEYARKTEPYTRLVPTMVVPGNHELFNDFETYQKRHFMPGASSGSNTNMFWSLNVDLVHIVGMNTESELDIAAFSQAQVDWLKADLAKVDRTVTPWIVVMGHRPFYCSSEPTQCNTMALILRGAAEQVLIDAKVDVVVQAHVHNYEVFWPMANGVVSQFNYNQPKAPVFIVNGAAGCREKLAGFDMSPLAGSRVRIEQYGFAELEIRNATWLRWAYYGDDQGTILDEFIITK